MKYVQQRHGIKVAYTRVYHDDGSYIFLYDPEVGETYALETFGAVIWEMAEKEIAIPNIAEEIYNIFEDDNLELESLVSDVNRIVKILCQRNLLIEREV